MTAALAALAAATISATDKFAHAANAGWIDFRPDAGNGVRVEEGFRLGHADSANISWIAFEQHRVSRGSTIPPENSAA